MKINDEQARAIGEIIQKEGLCHAQIGKYGDGWLYVYVSKDKVTPTNQYFIDNDGDWATSPFEIKKDEIMEWRKK